MLGGEPRRDRQQAGGRHRREQRCTAHRSLCENALDDRSAHRMTDQDRRGIQLSRRVFDVGLVIVESRDEQRLDAAARTVSAQAHGIARIAARGKPGEKIRLPEPRVAIAAVHEEQRRLARRLGRHA